MTATAQLLNPVAWLQYGLGANTNLSGAGVGATVALSLTVDRESFPNGLLLKQSATAFRALRNMVVEVHYSIDIDSDTNNIGSGGFVTRAGVAIPWSFSAVSTRADNDDSGNVGRSFLTQVSANQDLVLNMIKREAGATITAVATPTSVGALILNGTGMAVRVVRLL